MLIIFPLKNDPDAIYNLSEADPFGFHQSVAEPFEEANPKGSGRYVLQKTGDGKEKTLASGYGAAAEDPIPGCERAALRREHFARRLRWLRRIVVGLARKELPQSDLGKACTYLLNNWDVLVAHQQHSFTRLDNNLVENAIRPSAIGKKNWLFIGHPAAGQRSAIIYSLVVSCQRHGKDPLAYLRDMLQRLPAMTNQDDLTPLTPAAWQPS